MTNLKNHTTIGIEIEMVMNRSRAARLVADFFDTDFRHVPYEGYDRRIVIDHDGRKWRIDSDGSIDAPTDDKCEFVSPVLSYDDLPTLFALVNLLREHGARPDYSCGIHIHVGAAAHTPETVRNLVNLVNAHEDLLTESLGITAFRRDEWCQEVDPRFLRDLNKTKPATFDKLAEVWYGTTAWRNRADHHYDRSRYHLLNLHAIWQKKTIEFRAFNSTLDTDRIKAYVDLVLAMSYRARKVKTASPKRPVSDNHAYTFRCWLLALDLSGDEFKTTRRVLLENVPGNAAWRNGAPTQRRAA